METVALPVDNPGKGTDRQPHLVATETGANPMYMSLSQASRIWGKHKGTISKHVKEGKLQWHEQPGGEKKLFAAEVANLYGAPPSNVSQPVDNPTNGTASKPHGNPGNGSDVMALQATLNAKDDLIKVLQSQIDREREIAEQWRREYGSVKDQLLALPAPKTQAQPEKTGWWPFRRKG